MIEAVISEHVNAPAHRVRALYREPGNWTRLFPATILGARVVRTEGDTTVVEVDHAEGRVVNILRGVSSTRIDLVEFKRRYDATFVNEFIPEGGRHALHAHGIGSTEVAVPTRRAVCKASRAPEDAPICGGAAQGGGRK